MTVLENMLVPALSDSQGDRYKHHQKIVRQAQELLKFVQLGHMKDQLAKTLSGGQNMLLQIARGFMVDPLRLYLMDEPFAGVNPQIKSVIMESIKQMNREKGVTFIIVSHEMPSVKRLCNKVSVIHEGRMSYKLTRGDLGLSTPTLLATGMAFNYYYIFLALAIACLFIIYRIIHSRIGYFMRSIRDDEEADLSMGVDTVKWKRFVFATSSFFAGIAGGFYAHYIGLLSPVSVRFSSKSSPSCLESMGKYEWYFLP